MKSNNALAAAAAALATSASASTVTLSTHRCSDFTSSSPQTNFTVEADTIAPIPKALKPVCGLAIQSASDDLDVNKVVCYTYTDTTPPQIQPGEIVKDNGGVASELSQSLIRIGPIGSLRCVQRGASSDTGSGSDTGFWDNAPANPTGPSQVKRTVGSFDGDAVHQHRRRDNAQPTTTNTNKTKGSHKRTAAPVPYAHRRDDDKIPTYSAPPGLKRGLEVADEAPRERRD
ncbi:hypothetical protein ACJQWK_05867 [Exserohilum turcicum]|uniref:Uncharacterized protein n=1 Tax=Exserohilum turcicum (strain 28A) TaxID=671987 RepID=R0IN40_EXST2|nr:uncharacterized protein SETTUDRAFT_28446 [Exserohilum turcica Et28A]EOA86435.1 hypothetical protein SETTUDRAFT_28446 [Exserohilum turcica Et28A]